MHNRLFYLFILLLVLTSCTDSNKIYKIGVAQCSQGRWRDKVNQEMLAAQHLYEQDVKVCIAYSHDDTELQVRQIDSLANTGIDLLVVAPNEAEPIAQAVERVMEKGIPVIFFDRKAATDKYTAFIGGNNMEAGQTVGLYAINMANDLRASTPNRRVSVIEITGAMSTSPAQERHEGFSKVIGDAEGIDFRTISSDWTDTDAKRIVQQLLALEQLPDILFCHNDAMCEAVFTALKDAGKETQVELLGIDGMPDEGVAYVQQGHQSGSYVYPTHGDEIIRLALDIITGKPYQHENTLQGIMVTPDNADLVALNSFELIKQNGELITIHDKLEAYLGLYNSQRKVLIGSFVAIVLLVVAFIMMWRAYIQTRKVIRQRQTLNEEETLFYTNPDSRTLSQVFETPKDEMPAPKSQDTIFAETLNEAIRKNMANPNLKMDDLGDEIGLSRVQLYRKVKAITGLTPVELLRKIRLQQGYILLTTTNKTVAEIAFEVGFNTPGYFSKWFKEQYGKLPMDLRTET